MADEPTNPNPDEAKGADVGADTGKTGEGEAKEPSVDDLKSQLETVTKERDTFKEKSEKTATKLGKQSHEVKLLHDLHQLAKDQPREYIRKVAEKAGVGKIYFEDDKPADKIGLDLDGIDDDKLKALEALRVKDRYEMRQEVQDAISPLFRDMIAGKYSDWDDLADTRAAASAGRTKGILQPEEVDHLIARGLSMPAALNDAKEMGKAEYIASLQKKEGEHIAGSDASETVTTEVGMLDFSDVVKELNEQRI